MSTDQYKDQLALVQILPRARVVAGDAESGRITVHRDLAHKLWHLGVSSNLLLILLHV